LSSRSRSSAPRTRKRLEEFGFPDKLTASLDMRVTEPLTYIEFMDVVTE
jgi:hypothetical protein